MQENQLSITYVGGPTALLEINGFRFLTDPTFDLPGEDYTTGPITLHKLIGPAINSEALAGIDAVLLSHDQHFDNLGHKGRAFLANVSKVLTTEVAAARLGMNALGLPNWQNVDLQAPDGQIMRVTGTPAQHGPRGRDRGPVTGFVLSPLNPPSEAFYVSGDSVWFEGTAEVAQKFNVRCALLFMGAARVPAVGPCHLTMTAAEGVEAARAFSDATIVPLHFEGWAHLSE